MSSSGDGETKRASTYIHRNKVIGRISCCCRRGDTREKQPVVNRFHLPFLAEYLLLVCVKCLWREKKKKKKHNVVAIYIADATCGYNFPDVLRLYVLHVVRTEATSYLYRVVCCGATCVHASIHIRL